MRFRVNDAMRCVDNAVLRNTVRRLVWLVVLLACVASAVDAVRIHLLRAQTTLVIRYGVSDDTVHQLTRLHGGRVLYEPSHTPQAGYPAAGAASAVLLPADVSVAVFPPHAVTRIDGAQPVVRYLSAQQGAWRRAMTRVKAVILVLIGMLIATVMRQELSKLTLMFPLVLVALNGMPQFGCLSCSGYDGVIIQLMTFGVISSTLLLALTYWFFPGNQKLNCCLCWIGCIVPAAQAVAMLYVPILCYKCVISGFIIYASSVTETSYRKVMLPAFIRMALLFGVIMLLMPARQTAKQLTGQDIVPLYIGSSWSEHFSGEYPGGRICMVAVNDACRPCHRAMSELPSTGIPCSVARVKTVGNLSGSFDPRDKLAPTPLFLVYDEQGICSFVFAGWPLPEPVLHMIQRKVQ